MTDTSARFSWRNPWCWLWLLPWLMLAANALSWLRFGNDLPFVDDWRAYADGTAGRFLPLHWFAPTNNTMAPVGLALDALAQRVLGGNVVAYQFITLLVVQGGLLAAQWRLLRWAVGDVRLATLAFVGTVFMLQTGSYWGEQNLAYHQALPLLWLMLALCAGLTSTWRAGAVFCAALALGALAGLSYISGAVGAVVLALGLWAVLAVLRPLSGVASQRAHALALGLLLAGGAGTLLQWWMTRVAQLDSLGQSIPTASPLRADFWAYALGKLGRALGQPFSNLGWDAVLVATIWLACALVWLALLLRAWQHRLPLDALPADDPYAKRARRAAWLGVLVFAPLALPVILALRVWQTPSRTEAAAPASTPLGRVALVALPLVGLVLAYLMMVTFGRAGFRDAGVQTSLQVYAFGYQRFHFYWLTLCLPWVLAACAVLGSVWGGFRRQFAINGLILLALLGVGLTRSVFDVAGFYRSGNEFRASQWACLQQQWGSGEPIHCPIFDMPDVTGALLYARQINASFTRYLPLDRVVPGHRLYHWPQSELSGSLLRSWPGQLHDARPARDALPQWSEASDWLRTGADAQWRLDFGSQPALRDALANCQVLDVAVQVQASRAGLMQVFFAQAPASDVPQFEEQRSRTQAFQPADAATATDAEANMALATSGQILDALNQPQKVAPPPELAPPQTVHFAWESASGFAPQLRIDLADQPMWVRVPSLTLSCRLPTLAAWRAAQDDDAQEQDGEHQDGQNDANQPTNPQPAR